MAELADALDSGSSLSNEVQVQLLPWAPSVSDIFFTLFNLIGVFLSILSGFFQINLILWLLIFAALGG